MNAPAPLEVVSDFICPWCYLGMARLQQALDLLGADAPAVRWSPFQLNPDMPPEGMDRREYRSRKFGSWQASLDLDARIKSLADEIGLPIDFDRMQRTPNTLPAHGLQALANAQGAGKLMAAAIFRAYFVEGEDIGDPSLLRRLGEKTGLSGANLDKALDPNGEYRKHAAAEDAAWRQAGISGVPTFVLNRREAMSGAQPVEALLDWLGKR